jgi:hypothetical protein
MSGKRKYIIITWAIVLLTFFIEYSYLYNYLTLQKVKQYAQTTGKLFDEINQKINDLAGSGQLNYLLWSQGHMSDELRLVKAVHPLIQDVLIYSDEFHLLDATSDRFSASEMTRLLEKAENSKYGTSAVLKEGYLHIYPAMDEAGKTIKGYIVVALTAPPYLKQSIHQSIDHGSMFLMNITKGNLFSNNSGYLNESDFTSIREKLKVTEMDETGSLDLDLAGKREIFWSYYLPANIYFGYVRDAKPFYEFIYFYVLLAGAFINLVLVFSGNVKKSKKREIYEKIIQNNMQTLAEMKKGLEFIIQDDKKDMILEVEASITSSIEQAMSTDETVPVFYHRPDRGKGEETISDFILLDPLDSKWYKPIKRKTISRDIEKASRLSRAAFTPELLNLMEQISKKDHLDVPEKEIIESMPFEKQKTVHDQEVKPGEKEISGVFRSIEKDLFAEALERLYSVDEPGEELDIVLENLRIKGKADGLAIMFFDRNIGCYTIETSAGLDIAWARNFYLLRVDSVLACPVDQSNDIVVSDDLLQNTFFRKRIPHEYLNRIGAIKLMSIQNEKFPIRAALFFWRDGSLFDENTNSIENALAQIDNGGYSRLFSEILPALNKMYINRDQKNIHPDEAYRDIYNVLKSFTVLSDKKIAIVHAVLSTGFNAGFREKLLEQCKSIFKNYERYIVNNPTHLIFLLNETSPELVEKIILELDSNAELKVLKYPELGKNLFAYL